MNKFQRRLYEICKKIVYVFKKSILVTILLVSIFCIVKFSSVSVWQELPDFIKKILECPVEGTDEYEIWLIIYNLCLAYVASFIFYFVIDYIPKKENEKIAFNIISDNLVNIYSKLSYIIRMILFDIEVDKKLEYIKLHDLRNVKYLEFDKKLKYADITHIVNKKDINFKEFSFNVLDDCKICGESINKSINDIFSLPIATNINSELVELLVNIRKSRFLNIMSYFTHENSKKIPGRTNEILFYDESFLELIKYREALRKEKFDLNDYRFERMSKEKIKEVIERSIFWMGRSEFMQLPIKKIQSILSNMSSIHLDESNFNKMNGVLMEALVTYDIDNKQYGYMLSIAKDIAEFLCRYEGSEQYKDIACLNYLQVLRRMGTISKKNLKSARTIIDKPNNSNIVRLGALIIVQNFDEARKEFENLDEKQKLQVISLPIYRLWKNPPYLANIEQPDFNIYE